MHKYRVALSHVLLTEPIQLWTWNNKSFFSFAWEIFASHWILQTSQTDCFLSPSFLDRGLSIPYQCCFYFHKHIKLSEYLVVKQSLIKTMVPALTKTTNAIYLKEFLNGNDFGQTLLHTLTVKKRCFIMLLWNLNKAINLAMRRELN